MGLTGAFEASDERRQGIRGRILYSLLLPVDRSMPCPFFRLPPPMLSYLLLIP